MPAGFFVASNHSHPHRHPHNQSEDDDEKENENDKHGQTIFRVVRGFHG
jgi:hypothetical protein